MKIRRSLQIATACTVSGLLLPYLTICFIPDDTLLKACNSLLEPQGLSVQTQHLGRPFPFGISASKLTLSDRTAPLLNLDTLTIRPDYLSLITGRISFSSTATMKSGTVQGTCTIWPRMQGKFSLKNISLSDVPLFSSASGGTVKGSVKADVDFHRSQSGIEGMVKLQVSSVELSGVKINSLQLPDISCPELRSILKLKGQTINIDNLALQGNGIYYRLSGAVPLSSVAPMQLALEVLPSAEFLEKQKSLFLIMLPYQQSPGNYALKIGGTLNSPQLIGR